MGTPQLRSSTICIASILSILHAMRKRCGDGTEWLGLTKLQESIVDMYHTLHDRFDAGVDGITTIMSDDSNRLNQALANQGYEIRLPNFEPQHIGGVSFFKRPVTWLVPGETDELLVNGHWCPSIKLRHGYVAYQDADQYGRKSITVGIKAMTTGTDTVWLVPYQGPQLDGLDLLEAAVSRVRALKTRTDGKSDYNNGCQFPMVNLRHRPNISFLNGMIASGENGGTLGAMVQENVLRMDEKGAHVESATAGVLYRDSSPNITGPFLFILEHQGAIDFIALCAEDCFRDPRNTDPFIPQDELGIVEPGVTKTIKMPPTKPSLAPVSEIVPSDPKPVPSTGKGQFIIFV